MRYSLLAVNLFALNFTTAALATVATAAESIAPEQMRKCMETSVLRADETMTVKSLKEACQLLLSQPGNSGASLNPDESPDTSPPEKKTDQVVDSNGNGTTQVPSNVASETATATSKNQSSQAETKTPDHEDITNNDKPSTDETTSIPELETVNVPSKSEKNIDPLWNSRLLKDRMTIEALNRSNRFALTPNKRNYLKPVSYSDSPNTAPYRAAIADNDSEVEPAFTDLKHTEAELQLSVKILIRENIFEDNGHLYLGYTNHALWQVYNRKISAPFRESDHQPELILSFTNDWEIFGFRNVLNEAVLNHQSNGQSGLLSRSWNRVMFNSVFEKDDFVFAFNPWYRLPEKEARYRGDPKGDDNPDITHYMGNFQLTGAYKYKSDIFSVEVRNNLKSDNRGAIELGWTFPVSATMRGYVNYFDGYGHSLIDYNVKQQVLGLGIIFTDLF